MDLLYHEMLITCLLGCFRIPGYLCGLQMNFIAVKIKKVCFTRQNPYRLEIANIIDASGVFQNGGHIRCQIALTVSHADNHGGIFPGGVDLSGIIFKHHGKGIAAAYAHHHAVDGIDGSDLVLFIIVIHQFDDNFSVGSAVKLITVSQQLFLQLFKVFDDAVVNTDDV